MVSVITWYLIVLCKSSILLLIFKNLLVVSITERKMLKLPNLTVDLSLSSFSSFKFYFIYVDTLLLYLYTFRIAVFS